MKPKPANTPLEELWQNTKDIEILKQQIAPLYKCSVDLGNSSTACDVADTNLTENVEKAFIIDTKGNIYKFIAFNEDKTIAYIEFYSNIKGADGQDGQDGQDGRDGADDIDDNTIAYNKLWSSQKINTEIGKAKDKGLYYTITQPTAIDATNYILAISNIGNKNNDIDFKNQDLIIYIDGNGNPTEIYKIVANDTTLLTLNKIADYAKNHLYQHEIIVQISNVDYFFYYLSSNQTSEIIEDDVNSLKTVVQNLIGSNLVLTKTNENNSGFNDTKQLFLQGSNFYTFSSGGAMTLLNDNVFTDIRKFRTVTIL